MGVIFGRLEANFAVRHCAMALAVRLRPTERGVGGCGRVEHLAHTITVMLETRLDCSVLSVDINNAFSSISRESLLRETVAHLPGVVDLVFGLLLHRVEPVAITQRQRLHRNPLGSVCVRWHSTRCCLW